MPIYELVLLDQLVPGVTYRVKHYERDLGFLIFNRYEADRIVGTIPMSNITIRLFTLNHSFSRIISQFEFRAKLRDKFEHNALITILQNIIDESFL
jgi:hypothetical protein